MTSNKRLVAVGTEGKLTSVSLWEIRSKLCLKYINMPALVTIIKLSFSSEFGHLLVYGLNQ
jgi:hypothetical protein